MTTRETTATTASPAAIWGEPITNLHATVEEYSDRVGLGCDVGELRYHVWVTREAPMTIVDNALRCNPPRGIHRGDPGYFTTRRLDATAAKNERLVRMLLDNASRLIAEAQVRLDEKVRARKAKVAAERQEQRAADVRVALKLIDAAIVGDQRWGLKHVTVDRERLADAVADQFSKERSKL